MISRAESIANTITMTGIQYDEICRAHQQAGYQAAIEEAYRAFCVMDYNSPSGGRWQEYKVWIDAQVKKGD